MAKTVLVVDDDPTQRRLAQAVLEREGYAVVHAESGGEAIDRLTKGGGADVVLLDMVMPGMSGMEALAEIRTAGVTTPVIVLTASGGVDAVVKAMQAGAQDFFVKPVSAERLLVGVSNALQLTRLTAEVGRLKKHVSGRTSFDDLVGTSPPMRMVKSLGARAAKSSIPVLITGESGVGKEVIARALHGASDRGGKPFVAVNCGALPANLIESILFGHEKGAFTGAHDKHLGKFQEANGGTLFLDEIGELPLDMQVKLLRALQEGEVDPVGSKRSVKVDVRIVSATNRDPAQQVRAGAFREDLFYRLNVFPIEAPSLRERREDIPALIDSFARRFAGPAAPRFTPDVLRYLMAYSWPGNVRELQNFVKSVLLFVEGDAVLMSHVRDFADFFAHGEFAAKIPELPMSLDIPAAPPQSHQAPAVVVPIRATEVAEDEMDGDEDDVYVLSADGSPEDALVEHIVAQGLSINRLKKRLELECIRRALEETQGNVTQAAKLLQMKRPRLSQIINATPELAAFKNKLVG